MNDLDRVDKIEAVRVRNNGLWMNILRLALEGRPEETKAVLREIQEHDAAIAHLLKEIGNS